MPPLSLMTSEANPAGQGRSKSPREDFDRHPHIIYRNAKTLIQGECRVAVSCDIDRPATKLLDTCDHYLEPFDLTTTRSRGWVANDVHRYYFKDEKTALAFIDANAEVITAVRRPSSPATDLKPSIQQRRAAEHAEMIKDFGYSCLASKNLDRLPEGVVWHNGDYFARDPEALVSVIGSMARWRERLPHLEWKCPQITRLRDDMPDPEALPGIQKIKADVAAATAAEQDRRSADRCRYIVGEKEYASRFDFRSGRNESVRGEKFSVSITVSDRAELRRLNKAVKDAGGRPWFNDGDVRTYAFMHYGDCVRFIADSDFSGTCFRPEFDGLGSPTMMRPRALLCFDPAPTEREFDEIRRIVPTVEFGRFTSPAPFTHAFLDCSDDALVLLRLYLTTDVRIILYGYSDEEEALVQDDAPTAFKPALAAPPGIAPAPTAPGRVEYRAIILDRLKSGPMAAKELREANAATAKPASNLHAWALVDLQRVGAVSKRADGRYGVS